MSVSKLRKCIVYEIFDILWSRKPHSPPIFVIFSMSETRCYCASVLWPSGTTAPRWHWAKIASSIWANHRHSVVCRSSAHHCLHFDWFSLLLNLGHSQHLFCNRRLFFLLFLIVLLWLFLSIFNHFHCFFI